MDPCDEPLQAELRQSIPFLRNRLPKLVGGARFTNSAKNQERKVRSIPNFYHMSRVDDSTNPKKDFHFDPQGVPQMHKM